MPIRCTRQFGAVVRARGRALEHRRTAASPDPPGHLPLQLRKIGANACGVRSDITLPDPRQRAHVDPAPRCGRRDPDYDVILETEPGGGRRGLDAARRGVRSDKGPPMSLRRIERPRKGYWGWCGENERLNLRVGTALRRGDLGTAVRAGVRRVGAEREDRHKVGRMLEVRSDVVDRRKRARTLPPVPRQVAYTKAQPQCHDEGAELSGARARNQQPDDRDAGRREAQVGAPPKELEASAEWPEP